MNKAIFLDKDGTLIPDIPYNIEPDLIRLSENSLEGLRKLQEQGFLLIVISNQAGVARGYFEEHNLAGVEVRLGQLLKDQGIQLNDFYYCPHHPEGKVKEYAKDCDCRKPKPGMILKAAAKFNISLGDSWMIGDILNDIEAGNRAGCKTVLIDSGNETEWELSKIRTPTHKVETINEAALHILKPIKETFGDEYSVS